MDAEILARLQFAFTVAFHYIYPPLSIGLGVLLVIMEGMYLKTGNKVYETMTRFWVKNIRSYVCNRSINWNSNGI
jgi:cytochrome d ubiquinol oxidase subunit I